MTEQTAEVRAERRAARLRAAADIRSAAALRVGAIDAHLSQTILAMPLADEVTAALKRADAANTRRADARRQAAERDQQHLNRETRAQTLRRLTRQRYGIAPHVEHVADFPLAVRSAVLALPRLLDVLAGRALPPLVEHDRAALRAEAVRAEAFAAALVADGGVQKADHDAATCDRPGCRAAVCRARSSSRSGTHVGPLKRSRATRAPRERQTGDGGARIIREASLLAMLDQTRQHLALSVSATPADVMPRADVLAAAALAVVTTAGRRGVRVEWEAWHVGRSIALRSQAAALDALDDPRSLDVLDAAQVPLDVLRSTIAGRTLAAMGLPATRDRAAAAGLPLAVLRSAVEAAHVERSTSSTSAPLDVEHVEHVEHVEWTAAERSRIAAAANVERCAPMIRPRSTLDAYRTGRTLAAMGVAVR